MERFNSVTTRDYGLLSKVYGLLAFSIAFAIAGSVIGLSRIEFIDRYIWLIAIFDILFAIVTSVVSLNKRMVLLGFILLNVFAFIMGFTITPMLSFALSVNPATIVYALVTTAATFVGMSLVPIVFRVNVLGMGGFLFAGVIDLIIVSLVNLFLNSNLLAFVISVLGTVIFNLYVSYDTARILAKDPDATALSLALDLYVDVFGLFVNILSLFLDFSGNIKD